MKTSSIATLITVFVCGAAISAPNADERRRMIREFEAENQADRDTEKKEEAENQPPEERGIEPLRMDLNAARAEFLRDKSEEHRTRAENATLDFVEPLVRLRRFDEAIAQIELTVDLIGRQPAMVERIVAIRFDQAAAALDRNDFPTSSQILEKAGIAAKGGNLRELATTVDRALRDVYFEWAQDFFLNGDWLRAREKAQQALVSGIEPEPIRAFMARISYLSNDYANARKELEAALGGPYREAPEYLRFAEVLRWESYLERDFRRIPKGGILLSTPSGQVTNDRAVEEAFSKAREEAKRVFGLQIPLRVPLSVYPRSEFFQFCQSPQWRAVASIEGKLRVRADVLKGSGGDLEKVALYGYGLWLADILSEGKSPAWFQEGFAHQLALPTGPPNGALGALKRMAAQDRFPLFKDLEGPFSAFQDYGEAAQAMAQAQSGIQLIIEEKGLAAVVELLSEFRFASDPEDALTRILEYDYASFSKAWSDAMQSGFATKSFSDLSGLRSLGVVSPLGSYWQQ